MPGNGVTAVSLPDSAGNPLSLQGCLRRRCADSSPRPVLDSNLIRIRLRNPDRDTTTLFRYLTSQISDHLPKAKLDEVTSHCDHLDVNLPKTPVEWHFRRWAVGARAEKIAIDALKRLPLPKSLFPKNR